MTAKTKSHKLILVNLICVLALIAAAVIGCTRQGMVSSPNQPYPTEQATNALEKQQLQQLYNLTHSSEYSNALAELSKVQGDSSQLATFVEGLPNLPNLLNYVTIDDINTAIQAASNLRDKLSSLPPLPSLLPGFPLPPPPPPVKDAAQKLESIRQQILAVSEPIDQLPDLPSFIPQSNTLPEAKQNIDNHFREVISTAGDTTTVLQHLKDLSEKSNGNLADISSYTNSSEYETLLDKLNQINSNNNQLVTLVGSLPPLPTSLSNIPINKIENAVKIAKEIYPILNALPPLTLFSADPDIATLESLRVSAVTITRFLNELPNLPDFISGLQSLEQVRVKTLSYLVEVQNAVSHCSAIIQQVNQIVTGSQLKVPVSKPQQVTYNLSVSINPQGGGSVSPSEGQYAAGTPVTITATPMSGYVFDSWSGDASGSSPTITITMNSNKSVTATFTPIPTPTPIPTLTPTLTPTPVPTPTPTPTPTSTSMSFTVSGGPFGYKTLTSYLVQGQRVYVSFTIAGGNNDIEVMVFDSSNDVVAGSATKHCYTSGQISFTAPASGSYSLRFDNTFSVLTSKNVQVTITGGQWK